MKAYRRNRREALSYKVPLSFNICTSMDDVDAVCFKEFTVALRSTFFTGRSIFEANPDTPEEQGLSVAAVANAESDAESDRGTVARRIGFVLAFGRASIVDCSNSSVTSCIFCVGWIDAILTTGPAAVLHDRTSFTSCMELMFPEVSLS